MTVGIFVWPEGSSFVNKTVKYGVIMIWFPKATVTDAQEMS